MTILLTVHPHVAAGGEAVSTRGPARTHHLPAQICDAVPATAFAGPEPGEQGRADRGAVAGAFSATFVWAEAAGAKTPAAATPSSAVLAVSAPSFLKCVCIVFSSSPTEPDGQVVRVTPQRE